MEITYASLEIFASIILLLLFIIGLNKKTRLNKVFLLLIAVFILTLLVDSTIWLLLKKPEYINLLKVLWIIFDILLSGCVICFHEYIFSILDLNKKRSILSFYAELCGIASSILWIISMFNGMIYEFDASAMYIYKPTYIILEVILGLPLLIDIIIVFINKKKLGLFKTLVVISYCIFPTITIPLASIVGSTIYSILSAALSIMFIYIVANIDNAKDLAKKEMEINEINMDLADKQLKLVYSQIQPHFLYNVLNTIYYLVDDDTEKGKKAIIDFSDYMRINLDSLNQPMVIRFDEELRRSEIYLSLEKLRFEDELNIKYDIQTKNFLIPQLTLQPLIENAVKHGICKKKGGGTITIYTREFDTYFEIGIIDDGIGFDQSQPYSQERSHVGLSNIRYRVESLCNGKVDITSQVGFGTKVTITLPKEGQNENISSR